MFPIQYVESIFLVLAVLQCLRLPREASCKFPFFDDIELFDSTVKVLITLLK